MSSKRGRKRDDNLPPNRARDVQRAFRAKRAAHLQVRCFRTSILVWPHNASLHSQALEQRVNELEEENKYYRKVLGLPPSPRPSLGRGPTGKDRPDHDADKSRRQPASPCEESAGSPLSRTSSPELVHSPIAPSKSSLAITMDVDSPHRAMAINDRHTAFQSEQGHHTGESISIFPFKTPISLNHSDRNPPPLNSPSIAIYPHKSTSYLPTSDSGFIESDFASEPRHREARLNEVQQNFYGCSPNYPKSDQHLVHTFWDQGSPESRFPRPLEQVHPPHTAGYNRQQGHSRTNGSLVAEMK